MPSNKQCSRCKAFAVCSKECMKAVWSRHKADCNDVVAAQKEAKEADIPISGTPCFIDPEAVLRLNRRGWEVYQKHGIDEPPGRGSKMDVDKKLDFFLDVLKEHDTSSPENKNLSLAEKMFLNRRYNNTYRHAADTFTASEIAQLNALMRLHHVGMSNRQV